MEDPQKSPWLSLLGMTSWGPQSTGWTPHKEVDLGQSDLSVDLRFGRKRQGKGRGGWLTCRKMVVKLNGIEDCTDCTD